jgi:hypothetical protein
MALQHAIYLAFGLLTLGGILFLLAAIWIIPEKTAVDRSEMFFYFPGNVVRGPYAVVRMPWYRNVSLME